MSNHNITVGATVRFLDAVGGGKVVRISRDTAWVEDADGFEIPTPLHQCVVVESSDTFAPAYKPPTFERKPVEVEGSAQPRGAKAPASPSERTDRTASTSPQPQRISRVEDHFPEEAHEAEIKVPAPHTFVPASGTVNTSLAFIPLDIQRLGTTSYDVLLINDSKYSLYYMYSSREGNRWRMHAHGLLLPDHDELLETIGVSDLNSREHLSVQLIAFAENPGVYVDNYSIELKPDPRRLLKLHSFTDNDYMDDKALLLELVRDGKPYTSPRAVDAEALRTAMQETRDTKPTPRKQDSTPARRPGEPLVVDLHIEALIDSTAGMDNATILNYQLGHFHNVMQAHLRQTGTKIVFIHGKGEGVLRSKIVGELKHKYKHCHWQDASFREYSFGATQVTIGQLK